MLQSFVAKLSDKEKKIFYITIAFVLLALFDRLFLGPVLDKIDMIDQDIAQQEVIIKSDLKIISSKDKIINESKSFSKYFVKTVKDDDVINAEFLSTIERIATSSKVTLVKSNPSETKKHKDYIEYFASLDCSGKLEDMVTFMHKINATDDLLKVAKLNLSPKRGALNEVNASMTIGKLIISQDAVK